MIVADFEIEWCSSPELADDLAAFFVANIDALYISHGEIQDGRALDENAWNPELQTILTEEFQAACSTGGLGVPGLAVAVASFAGERVGVALVEHVRHNRGAYLVLHDLMIHREYRGRGLGNRILGWIEQASRETGLSQIFLESGKRNDAAHHFFQARGYCATSLGKV